MVLRALLMAVVLVLGGALLWLEGPTALQASDVRRSLADYRLVRMPFGVPWPRPWVDELRQALDAAPEVSLLDESAPAVAAEVFRSVSWIDPRSVQPRLRLPEGLEVAYRPRAPAFLLIQRAVPVGVLAADGVLLPPGLPGETKGGLLQLELPGGDRLPEPGRPVASAVALEGLRAWGECAQLQEISGLRVRRIEPAPGPAARGGLAPRLAFRLRDGRLLVWGRTAPSAGPDEPDFALKMGRLGAVLRQYPALDGVQEVQLDTPGDPRVLDRELRLLPFHGPVFRIDS